MEMATLMAFVLTKNEYDLIEDFVRFYASLCGGYDRVVVIDNGSTDPRVLSVYSKPEFAGLHVRSDTRPMTEQRAMMTDAMLAFRHRADFLPPLDTDEFLLWGEARDMPSMSRDMRGYLAALPAKVSVVRYAEVLFSVPDPRDKSYVEYSHARPAVDIRKFRRQPFDKIIVRAADLLRMHPGNHSADLCPEAGGQRVVADQLRILHFHDVGVRRTFERTLAAVTSYGFRARLPGGATTQDDFLAVAQHVRGIGGHHALYFLRFAARSLFIETLAAAVHRLPSATDMIAFARLCDTSLLARETYEAIDPSEYGEWLLARILEHALNLIDVLHKDSTHLTDAEPERTRLPHDALAAPDMVRLLTFGVGWPSSSTPGPVSESDSDSESESDSEVFSETVEVQEDRVRCLLLSL